MSFAAFFLAFGLPQAPTADGLTRLYDLHRLAGPAEERVLQFSSYDRTGGNSDSGQFLFYDEKTDSKTLADIQGPGIITRIWSANPGGTLKIYLDDNEKPRLVGHSRNFSGTRFHLFIHRWR